MIPCVAMNDPLLFAALAPWLKPLWLVAAGAVAVIVALGLLQMVVRWISPKLSAVAWSTAKECLAQPLFYVLLAIGVAALLVFPIFPYFTFGEDVKVVKDTGLVMIMVLSVILALWTASVSVAEEIEGRTAMTVLSKPIARWHFILGKFLGIIIPVVILFVVLSAVFLFTISYKVKYDARESCLPAPTAEACQTEMEKVVPGLVLAFMETVVLASISVAISTRLSMLPNLLICGSIYVLGHLVPTLVNSAVGQLEFVRFVADLLSTVLPMLEHFNIYSAIAAGKDVSWSYVGWAGLYCAAYSTAAMLLALLLFEDRDLA
jgi:ABC-type transport system involved in multi-copper enzyme maturation permease subunit